MKSIPTLDVAQYRAGNFSSRDYELLANACEDLGFFLVKGHGLDSVTRSVFSEAESFFGEDKDYKMKICRDEDNPLGYFDRELTKRKRDKKEVFDFKTGGYISKRAGRGTRWPEDRDDFRVCLTRFFGEFTVLSEAVIEMIFVSLGMEKCEAEGLVSTAFGEEHSSAARLNFYPSSDPVPEIERKGLTPLGDMALHHHTDPGAITLLLQDDHGGLQALSTADGWIDVGPEEGAIVVNIGDVMQVWTNDQCKSGVHRVVPVGPGNGRYSVPFFYQPRFDALIEPWEGARGDAKFMAFKWQEFIKGRVADNFADYGAEDIQIDKYRLA